MTTRRIVVTGARDYAGETYAVYHGISAAIDDVRAMALLANETLLKRDIVIAQGGSGVVDGLALQFAIDHGYAYETHVAKWAAPPRKHDPAGPIRNGKMLRETERGEPCVASVCVGFPFGTRKTSPGTWDCIEQAAALGIFCRVYGSRR